MSSTESHISISEFIDIGLLARLPELEWKARFLVSGLYAGMHKSPFRGTNAEFKEHREYFHGDSINMIDWKVYARLDRLYIRLYEEDTDLSAAIYLDSSKSMDFKSDVAAMNKWDYAASIAAACMLFMSKQKDKFTLTTLGDTPDHYIKPSGTYPHFVKMLERLRSRPSGADYQLPEVLRNTAGSLRQGSIVILISDFYTDISSLYTAFDALRAKDCEIIVFHVLDPRERDFSYKESLYLQDSETGEKMILSPDLVRKEYQKKMEEHISALTDAVKSRSGDYVQLITDRVPLEALITYLFVRNRRGGRSL